MSNHNIHKSSYGICFLASDPLMDRFYLDLSIKGSEAQKQRWHELLWMLWFDGKSISTAPIYELQTWIHKLFRYLFGLSTDYEEIQNLRSLPETKHVSIARSLSYSTQQRLYNVQFIFISMSKSIFTDSASLKFLISFCLDLPLEHCSGFNHAINFHIQLVNLP